MNKIKKCPKCEHEIGRDLSSCPYCGVIIEKYLANQSKQQVPNFDTGARNKDTPKPPEGASEDGISFNDWIQRAKKLTKSAKLQEAVDAYSAAIEHDTAQSMGYLTYYQRGLLYQNLGREAEATDDFRKAAELGNTKAKDYLKESKTLSGGIAHKFNNLLTVIQGSVSLMLQDTPYGHPHWELLKKIERQVKSGIGLTNGLIKYAVADEHKPQKIDLNRLVGLVIEKLQTGLKSTKLRTDLSQEHLYVIADPNKVARSIYDLVNGVAGSGSSKELILSTGLLPKNGSDEKASRDYVLLELSFPQLNFDTYGKEWIFDPILASEKIAPKIALSFAQAYRTLKVHGGTVSVTSRSDGGTKLELIFPAAQQRELPPDDQAEVSQGTILVVDDEEMVLDTTSSMLTHLGYRVLKAKTGLEATQIYQEHKDNIELIMLDMIMPDMDGSQTYDTITSINSHPRVLLMSGYAADKKVSKLVNSGCEGFIQKPFDLETLSSAVSDVLQN